MEGCWLLFLFWVTLSTAAIVQDNRSSDREAKDLIYEAMKMRTGNWKTWNKDRYEVVGGGILEKKLLEQGAMPEEDFEGHKHESRGQFFNFLFLLAPSIPHSRYPALIPLPRFSRIFQYSYILFFTFAEMQCCDQLTIESWSGVKETHPYVLGDFKKIGKCQGKSFYQHQNNTDIFLYRKLDI